MENSTARYSTPASRAISISTHLTQICMNKPRTIDEQLNKSEHIQFPAPAAAFFRFYPSAAEGISGSGIKGPCRHGRGQADLIPLWLGNLCKLATIYIYVRVHVGSARRWWRVGRFWWYPHAPLLMMWGNCAIFFVGLFEWLFCCPDLAPQSGSKGDVGPPNKRHGEAHHLIIFELYLIKNGTTLRIMDTQCC